MFTLLILSLIFQTSISVTAATIKPTYFARVMYDDVYLYRSPTDNDDMANLYFKLPVTYFVELYDSYDQNFYCARYMGFEGYVKKDMVQAIIGRPSMPYLSVNFRVYDERSRDMRKLPTTSGGSESQVYYLPCPEQNLTLIGTIEGDTVIEKRTNIWYFCKYSGEEDYYGYIYSDDCDDGNGNTISWQNNNEIVTYTENVNFNISEQNESLPQDNKTISIIVAMLSVPAIIFVILLFKGSKLVTKERKQPAREVKDY